MFRLFFFFLWLPSLLSLPVLKMMCYRPAWFVESCNCDTQPSAMPSQAGQCQVVFLDQIIGGRKTTRSLNILSKQCSWLMQAAVALRAICTWEPKCYGMCLGQVWASTRLKNGSVKQAAFPELPLSLSATHRTGTHVWKGFLHHISMAVNLHPWGSQVALLYLAVLSSF